MTTHEIIALIFASATAFGMVVATAVGAFWAVHDILNLGGRR